MDELDMEKARKMNMLEIRAWQREIIGKIESDFDELSISERKDLQSDLRYLEGIRDARKGISALSNLQMLTVDEYKEMSKSNSDKDISSELGVSRSTFADWKRKKGLIPWNKNMTKAEKI
ncbi:TPA_asm: MerR family transcriptional regulator [Listeria monocytogenes]|nr:MULTISPECIES: phage terminase small subunit-related protein [Listeria]EAC2431427.1 MerR family transcriptional regulator [Listeria monocytogenes]EAC6733258.1 MerR family transcriptional regulator [Listeria monocytogenes]EAD6458297.1 MerR family transcriptional regulator [Listeria monocytogenes]EAD6470479.1 MerR family transcriptional regulator [Listeria monocytogenes]EAD6595128.1 MerR family transcriptional regulator [Listeria monocytogenes]